MTVLVTGAAGFVGLNIVRKLVLQGVPVVALVRNTPDRATLRFLGHGAEIVRFVCGDVCDRAGMLALVEREGVRRIVHGAAITSSEAERNDPATFTDVNLGGTLNLLEAARQVKAERVVLISSSGIYGAPSDPTRLIDEDDPLQIEGSTPLASKPVSISVAAMLNCTVFRPLRAGSGLRMARWSDRPVPDRRCRRSILCCMLLWLGTSCASMGPIVCGMCAILKMLLRPFVGLPSLSG